MKQVRMKKHANLIKAERLWWWGPWSGKKARAGCGSERTATPWRYADSKERPVPEGATMNETPPTDSVLPGLEAGPGSAPAAPSTVALRPRVKPVDRSQLTWQMLDVERLIDEDHPARALWGFVGKLNLDRFYGPIEAVEGAPGRTPLGPPPA